jgi:hypothetical protein
MITEHTDVEYCEIFLTRGACSSRVGNMAVRAVFCRRHPDANAFGRFEQVFRVKESVIPMTFMNTIRILFDEDVIIAGMER